MRLESLAASVLDSLRTRGAWLATVESCTGGLVASSITDIAGSSLAFWGGFVVYDNSAKTQLGVAASTLTQHGAVSSATAQELAVSGLARMQSALKNQNSHFCVATTGIAGPTGGTADKPVGLCWIALAQNGAVKPLVREIKISSDTPRGEMKRRFAEAALSLVLENIETAIA